MERQYVTVHGCTKDTAVELQSLTRMPIAVLAIAGVRFFFETRCDLDEFLTGLQPVINAWRSDNAPV